MKIKELNLHGHLNGIIGNVGGVLNNAIHLNFNQIKFDKFIKFA